MATEKETRDVPSNIATEEEYGVVRLANVNDLYDGILSDGVSISPSTFSKTIAKEEGNGVVKIATLNDMREGVLSQGYAISPLNLKKYLADTSNVGLVRLANSDISKSTSNDALTKIHYETLKNIIETVKGELLSSIDSSNVPVGLIGTFPVNNIPSGWLLADGKTYDGKVYPKLKLYLGSAYSRPNGNFFVPDYMRYAKTKSDIGELLDELLIDNRNIDGQVICIKAFDGIENETNIKLEDIVKSYNKLSNRMDALERKVVTNSFYENRNGWFIDSSTGYMQQWGTSGISGYSTRVNFPTKFGVCYNVTITQYGRDTTPFRNPGLTDFDNSGFSFHSEVGITWTAIGRRM